MPISSSMYAFKNKQSYMEKKGYKVDVRYTATMHTRREIEGCPCPHVQSTKIVPFSNLQITINKFSISMQNKQISFKLNK